MNEKHAHTAHFDSSDDVERKIGRVRHDEGNNNAAIEITISDEGRSHFRRDLYVGIFDTEQDIEFIGRVVAGPFHRGRSADDYTVEGTVEIMGQLEDARRIRPTATRPRPLSEVYAFEQSRLQDLLGMTGDFHMGRLAESGRVEVVADSNDKGFLPRNIGIFGTVGSGKSNTAQVMMEEALDAGWAVVVVDVEGEYSRMNEPTDDQKLIELLRDNYNDKPAGVADFKLYEPASGNSGADSAPFKVPISAMKPEVVSDILNFTDAQSRMFEAVTRSATGRNAYLNRPENRRSRAGAPGSVANGRTMPGMPSPTGGDAAVATAPETESDDDAEQLTRPYNLQDLIDGLQESNQAVSLLPRIRQDDLPIAASLRTKLAHLAESGVVDSKKTDGSPELPIEDMLVGSRLSVVDVSETDDQSRNVTIAYTLQALFEEVIRTPVGGTMPNGGTRPRLLVVIEEVHNFVSRAMAHRMRTVLDSLQIISRRGRKRWMALALISQQPNHVPDELFELANTRFIHQMKAVSNLDSLKQTTGGVHEALWSEVPVLGVGRCLVSGTIFNNPLFVDVRPAKTRRLYVH